MDIMVTSQSSILDLYNSLPEGQRPDPSLFSALFNTLPNGAMSQPGTSNTTQVSTTSTPNAGGYAPQAGYGYDVLDRQNAQETYINNLTAQHEQELQALNAESQKQLSLQLAEINRQVQMGQTDKESADRAKALAQQESEFARTLAQNKLTQQHDYELQKANLDISKSNQAMQERELQSRLAANPQDFVQYEFYKRALGQPGSTMQQAIDSSGVDANGYPSAPPAYDDNTLQSVAKGLFSGSTTGYNPNLSGTGVFGAPISAPNQISRMQNANLSDSERGIINSFLNAGIDMGNGKRTSIDSQDFWAQQKRSQVPTLGEGSGQATTYGA